MTGDDWVCMVHTIVVTGRKFRFINKLTILQQISFEKCLMIFKLRKIIGIWDLVIRHSHTRTSVRYPHVLIYSLTNGRVGFEQRCLFNLFLWSAVMQYNTIQWLRIFWRILRDCTKVLSLPDFNKFRLNLIFAAQFTSLLNNPHSFLKDLKVIYWKRLIEDFPCSLKSVTKIPHFTRLLHAQVAILKEAERNKLK